jgi:uncharacterized protein (TIGR02099 family)
MSLIPPVAAAATAQRIPSGSPRWRPLRWAARALLGLVLVAGSLLLIAWLTLHWGILPRIEQWRPQLEARASQALGVPVRIGAIEVRSSSWVPAFELRDVVLLDTLQRPALQLPKVVAAISPRSLLSLELRFEQLLIEGAKLEVRRDVRGRVFVAGLDFGATGSGDEGMLRDWFFKQHEFAVRGGTLRWSDDQRAAPPLELKDVELVVRNGLLQHELRLDGTPDAAWGERFSLRGRFTQPLLARSGDWRRWSGAGFIDLPRVDVRELRRHVDLPFELSEGDGAVRAWVEVTDGRPRGATVDLALRAVSLRLASSVDALSFEQVEGRFVARQDAAGVSLGLQRFGFVTGDGIRWPQGDMTLAWRQREGEAVSGGEFTAQHLDLALMAQVASRIPLGDALAQLLDELKPQGIVSDLGASWDGPLAAPRRYQAKARLQGLSLAARPSAEPNGIGRPGLHNATLQVDASETGGTAQLALDAGSLEFPGVFAEPVVGFDALNAQLLWKIEPARTAEAAPRISVQVRDVKFANADAQGDLSASWSTGPGEGAGRAGRYPGQLELNGRIARGQAGKVARYLPLGIPEAPRRYVERAVRGGTVGAATFRVKGDLADFPFYSARTAKDGEFRIVGKVEDVTFAYVPGEPGAAGEPPRDSPWPAFTKVAGELVIDRSTLEIRNAQAQSGGVALTSVQGDIRNLGDRAVLAIEGTGRGPLGEMLRFVNTTPVGQWTGQALARASGSGNAELKLALSVPLQNVDATSTKGSVVLPGNDVRLTPDSPMLGNARGRVDFSQGGFTIAGATARVLGGEASFDGGTQPDGALRFNGQGTVTADGLRRAGELGLLARAGAALTGQATYRASLGVVRGQPEVSVTSNLVGLAVDLPAPLRKTAEAPLAMRFQTQLVPESLQPGQVPRDTLRFELGNVVQAQYTRELGAGTAPRVLRGGIGVLEPAPTPATGVAANVNLPTLRTDAWEAAAERLFGGEAVAAAASGGGTVGAAGYSPNRIALRVQDLQTGTHQFSRLVAGISHEEGVWRANVEAEQLDGYVEYRPSRSAQAAGRVYARLARLSLPKSDADQVETLLDQQQPATVPALDIVVDDFELRGKRLGKVEIEAVNRLRGEGRDAVREWRLARFNIAVPEARLSGSGSWSEVGGTFLTVPGAASTVRRRAVLDFKLEMNDAGALLERLGTGRAIRGGKGQLSGQVSWLGSPLALDIPSLAGQVNVAVDAGQFLKAEPGATRLLSVLSLQSLPRRLALDFRDVFQEGFAFDNVTGDVKITNGVAQTNNLRMRGVQAAVLMEGSADIARETQDLRVVVVPEINAGTASLAYAVINPAIGLGTFLAQALLRKPLAQAGTREFRVTGPWADPKVERIERKFGDAVPDVDAPLPAPGAASAARP